MANALLTWDRLEYIVPFDGYQSWYQDPLMAKAIQLIGVPRVVTADEKKQIHGLVQEMLGHGVPAAFKYSPRDGKIPYEIYPEKIAEDTYELLRAHGLTSGRLDNYDYPMERAAGLGLMTIIADVLGGQTRARITDQPDAYSVMANIAVLSKENIQFSETYERVVPITMSLVDADLTIEDLIELRRRERDEREGAQLRKLRHNYLATIEKHIKEVVALKNEKDRQDIDDVFKQKMKDDLTDLRDALKLGAAKAATTKDVIALAIAGAGMLAYATGNVPMPEVISGGGGAALLGGLLNTHFTFAQSRRDILAKHPMAYLYEAGK